MPSFQFWFKRLILKKKIVHEMAILQKPQYAKHEHMSHNSNAAKLSTKIYPMRFWHIINQPMYRVNSLQYLTQSIGIFTKPISCFFNNIQWYFKDDNFMFKKCNYFSMISLFTKSWKSHALYIIMIYVFNTDKLKSNHYLLLTSHAS